MRCTYRGTVPPTVLDPRAGLALLRARRRALRRGEPLDPPLREGEDELPELDEVLAAEAEASPAVVADLALFGDFLTGNASRIGLEGCEYESSGRVWVSYVDPRRAVEVRPGDAFVQGAVFTGDARRGHVRVACRLVRLICRNGQVMPLGDPLGTPVYERFEDGGTRGELDAVLEASVDGRVVEASSPPLRRATVAPATTLQHALVLLRLAGRVGLPPAVERAFAEEGEPTVYGALNAVTRSARDAETLVERESLERLAGEMMVRLYGVSAAAGVSDLQPV